MPKRVLVIDAIATHRIRFAALLETARYKVDTASDCFGLQSNLSGYDIVLVGLPDDRPGELIATVAKALQGRNTPMLCLDSKNSPLRRMLALRAGAQDIIRSQSPDDLVLALVRSLIRQAEAEREADRRRMTAASFGFSDAIAPYGQRARIMVVGALGHLPERLSALLPHEVTSLPDGADVQDRLSSQMPDAIMLGLGEGRLSARHVLPELRDQTHLSPIPIMAVYPEGQPHLATDALDLGASETVLETAGLEEFELRIANMLSRKARDDALRRSNEQSYRLAATDPLTGLYNRRYAETYMSSLLSRSDKMGSDFSVLLVDIDYFKSVNDTFGHGVGDIVLREVACRLQDNLRACDLVARYGGEEFLVVLPETSCATAALLAERLRCAIAARTIPVAGGREIDVTASIGVAGGALEAQVLNKCNGTSDQPEGFMFHPFQTVFDAADTALYRAKSAGRDRVEVSAA